jgi:5-methylcytosine-specific restriction endonuclease McrA
VFASWNGLSWRAGSATGCRWTRWAAAPGGTRRRCRTGCASTGWRRWGRRRIAPAVRLDRDELERLIDAGLSVRGIAQAVDRSAASVRHWLRVHGLETRLTETRRLVAQADGRDIELTCRHHGRTTFRLRGYDAQYRCLRCQSEQVIERRRRLRARLVAEAGGSCALCGYHRYVGALHFHHVDPSTKAFALGGGATRSLERNRQEAAKCVLLCSNCHAEVEAGLKLLP